MEQMSAIFPFFTYFTYLNPFFGSVRKIMRLFCKILAIGSVVTAVSFAQEPATPPQTDSTSANSVNKDTSIIYTVVKDSAIADSMAKDSVAKDTVVKDTIAADTAIADTTPKKPRNKITFAEYQAKVNAKAKKGSKTLHHGLSVVSTDYHDKRYGVMDHDADWGSGIGLYYFYRRYFGNYFGMQGRIGALYRYSRWNFDISEESGKLSTGEKYTLVHNVDRKYHNFALDMPLTGKLGYHIKGTTTFLFTSITLGLTKPLVEMVDTENRLYLNTSSKSLKNDLQVLKNEGKNPFPLYESHQTKEPFYMDDWETNSWIGLGIENRLVSFEFQVFGIGASTKDNHRYHHLGHDSDFTWRIFLDFSIR